MTIMPAFCLLFLRLALAAPWTSLLGNPQNTGVSTASIALTDPVVTSFGFSTGVQQYTQAVGTPLFDSSGNLYISAVKISFETGYIFSYDRNFHLRWQRILAGGCSIPTLDDARNVLYVTSAWNIPPMTLHAISTVDGTVKWNYTLPKENSIVTAAPLIHPQTGLIILVLDNYRAVAFDTAGSVAWNTTYVSRGGSLFGLQPALQGDRLLLADQMTLYGLNVITGALEYRSAKTPNGEQFHSGPLIDSRGVCVLTTASHPDEFLQYYLAVFAYQCVGGGVVELDARAKWAFRTPSPFPPINAVLGTPALSADGLSIYVGSTSLMSISATTGKLEWMFNYTAPGQVKCQSKFDGSTPVIGSDGTIFVGVNGVNCYSFLFALDPTSRPPPNILWKLQMNYFAPSVVVGDGQLVYFDQTLSKVWVVSQGGGHSASSASPSVVPSPVPTSAAVKPSAAPTPATTSAVRQPSAAPSPAPPTPLTPSPSAAPSPAPTTAAKKPSAAPSPSPTSAAKKPSSGATLTPSKTCACPYSFQGSASTQVCQQCMQAASCCTYCPTQPDSLCQTTSSSQQCSKAITAYADCSGGSAGSGSSTLGEIAGPSSLPGWKTAVIVLTVLGSLGAVFGMCRQRFLRGVAQAQAQAQPVQQATHSQHEVHADIIPSPAFGQVVNPVVFGSASTRPPVFGDDQEGGERPSFGGVRRLAPSAPQTPYEKNY